MKLFNIITLLICCSIISIHAESIRSFDGNMLFKNSKQSFKTETAKLLKSENKDKILATMNLQKQYADRVFIQEAKKIKVDNFPINTVDFGTIVLEKMAPVVDANTKFKIMTKEGEKLVKGPMIVSYSGSIQSYPDSKVFLSYCDGVINGYTETGDGRKYDFTTSSKDYNSDNPLICIAEQNYMVADKDKSYIQRMICYTQDIEDDFEEISRIKLGDFFNTNKKWSLLECKIAIEAMYNFYTLMGSDETKAYKYIVSVMAHVSKLYEEYVNVRITVPDILIYTSEETDPYFNCQNFEEKLEKMKYVREVPAGASLVCMFTNLYDRPDGSATAGLSYGGKRGFGSLCTPGTCYSVFGITGNSSYPNYNYTWDVSVAAHEIGHNFGSPHTHSCTYNPPIDTCVTKDKPPLGISDACFSGDYVPAPGTIMSYCHVTNSTNSVELKFHPRETPYMRSAAELASGCISKPAKPYISLLAPLVENSFLVGNKTQVRWTSSSVSYVKIQYSIDKGANWIEIIPSVAANDTIYVWTIPDTPTKDALLIVSDANDPSVSDTTDLTFSIFKPSITINSPAKTMRFGQKEVYEIQWVGSNVNSYNVEFSSNGGESWTALITNTKYQSFSWNIPEIVSESCIIKIYDYTNNKIVTQSPTFAIGKPTLKIVRPDKDAVVCNLLDCIISWDSDFINSIFLYYSLNNGDTWKKVYISSLDANMHRYTWKVPNIASDTVKLKAVMMSNTSSILDITEYSFVIDTCNTPYSVNDNLIDDTPKFKITSIVPNPVNNIATINYECLDNANNEVVFYIADINGRIALNSTQIKAECGINSINVDMSNIATGSYILYVQMGNSLYSKQFIINR